MDWSPQQDQALKAVDNWIRKGKEQVFYLAGFAGTGKTTLAKHLAGGVDGTVKFAAYTGKAALVLSTKGCPATTIHKLIYVPKSKSKARLLELQEELAVLLDSLGDLQAEVKDCRPEVIALRQRIVDEEENLKKMIFTLNLDSEVQDSSLVVIDECSMVDERIGEDLLSFGTKVLVLGDPAQLPPVGGGGFFTGRDPDFMLTEIHRQAADSPIIRMATDVRQRKELEVGSYGNCAVHAQGTPMAEIAKMADQIICGKNKTRHAANRRMREFLGHTRDLPVVGDRMVCLRNNHQLGLLNGQIWIAAEDAQDGGETYALTAYNEDKEADVQTFEVWAQEPAWYDRNEAEEFDYGYALTCHKSQGSQWDHVMVMDEGWVFRQNKHRWLYTAITRAAERVDIVKM